MHRQTFALRYIYDGPLKTYRRVVDFARLVTIGLDVDYTV